MTSSSNQKIQLWCQCVNCNIAWKFSRGRLAHQWLNELKNHGIISIELVGQFIWRIHIRTFEDVVEYHVRVDKDQEDERYYSGQAVPYPNATQFRWWGYRWCHFHEQPHSECISQSRTYSGELRETHEMPFFYSTAPGICPKIEYRNSATHDEVMKCLDDIWKKSGFNTPHILQNIKSFYCHYRYPRFTGLACMAHEPRQHQHHQRVNGEDFVIRHSPGNQGVIYEMKMDRLPVNRRYGILRETMGIKSTYVCLLLLNKAASIWPPPGTPFSEWAFKYSPWFKKAVFLNDDKHFATYEMARLDAIFWRYGYYISSGRSSLVRRLNHEDPLQITAPTMLNAFDPIPYHLQFTTTTNV